jgi:hypothetical protein
MWWITSPSEDVFMKRMSGMLSPGTPASVVPRVLASAGTGILASP